MKYDANGYYEELKVKYDATLEEIKDNYRQIAKKWHPDSNKSEEALEKFQKISVAYDVLKDEKKRIIYDLLSQVYDKNNVPDMFSLKIYKNMSNKEDASIRSLKMTRVVGKLFTQSIKEEKIICNKDEAEKQVLITSVKNWLFGWWSPKAFINNIKAIMSNIKNIEMNKADNLRLLVHNSLAYWQENKLELAASSAVQAKEFANVAQSVLLDKLLLLIDVPAKKQRKWNYAGLRLLQLIIPRLLLLFVLVLLALNYIDATSGKRVEQGSYYKEVKFRNTNKRGFDDVLVSKVLGIPVDTTDDAMLYHFVRKTKVMYGPDEDFDIMAEGVIGQTVRLTGYTPDKQWFRIMLDNGEMGFVRGSVIKLGIGNEIPQNSKIYTKVKF